MQASRRLQQDSLSYSLDSWLWVPAMHALGIARARIRISQARSRLSAAILTPGSASRRASRSSRRGKAACARISQHGLICKHELKVSSMILQKPVYARILEATGRQSPPGHKRSTGRRLWSLCNRQQEGGLAPSATGNDGPHWAY